MALDRLDVRGLGDRLESVLPRPEVAPGEVAEAVAAILAEVRRDGDDALRLLTARFDGVDIEAIRVPTEELKAALERIPDAPAQRPRGGAPRGSPPTTSATRPEPAEVISDGVRVTHLVRPVARAGCYVPGGLARYPSTVLMCAVPARVAGVDEVVLCVPPGPDGRVDDATLAAAAIAGVDEVYRVGGAQAVAAMAYGTESIRRVDVIVGPGQPLRGRGHAAGLGRRRHPSAFAGPSEVLVVAGPETPAELAAIDLAVQAEHGPDGLSWLVTWSPEKLDEIDRAARAHRGRLARAARRSSRRCPRAATRASSTGPEEAMAVANVVAPEHLELMIDDARRLLPLVQLGRRGVPRAAGRPPRSATTWPGPTTCCRPTARRASPPPCSTRRLPPAHPRRRGGPRRDRRGSGRTS